MSRRVAAAVLVSAAMLPLGSCTTSGAKPTSTVLDELGEVTDLTGRSEVAIEVIDNGYKPKVAKVSPGTRITFRNTGANPHNVTPFDDGAFPAMVLTPGQSAELTVPQKAGALPFYCTIHGGRSQGQRGALTIAPPF